jgi:hypothetical protein
MIVISCFDLSTNMVKPWANAGFTCYCVDIQHPLGETINGNIIKVGCDVSQWMPPKGKIAFASFFPPCTHTAISGAKWFKGKGLFALAESIRLFAHCIRIAEYIDAPYIIEHPTSTISTYWRKPDHQFDPCDYGDPWTKKTHLWTGNGFIMPPKQRIHANLGSKTHKMGSFHSYMKSNLRSETPMGFANAVFNSNKPTNRFSLKGKI